MPVKEFLRSLAVISLIGSTLAGAAESAPIIRNTGMDPA